MGFPEHVSNEVMVKCDRHCCLCGEYMSLLLQLHHIVPKAQGGDDSADNCIPVCPTCHAQVANYNPKHALVRKYTPTELKAHRDKCYAKYSLNNHRTSEPASMKEPLFSRPNTPSSVRWGFPELDRLSQLDSGMVVLVGGCSGSGKSILLQNVARMNLYTGKKVLYICMKDSPKLVLNSIIAQAGFVGVDKVNKGTLTAEEWSKISEGLSQIKVEDLKLLSSSEISSSKDVITLVEKSGAEIVIVDDFGGLFLEQNNAVSQFMYQIKQAAIKSNSLVFIIHNIELSHRMDQRPYLRDFPSDSYYRLCDTVVFLFRPAMHYRYDDIDEHMLEVIVSKNIANRVGTVELVASDEMALVSSYDPTPSNETTKNVVKAFDLLTVLGLENQANEEEDYV